jgi:hypothetical protein
MTSLQSKLNSSPSSSFDLCGSARNKDFMDCRKSMEEPTGCFETAEGLVTKPGPLATDHLLRFDLIRFRHDSLGMSDATLDALRSQLKEILTEMDNIQMSRRNMSAAAINTGQRKRQPSDQDQVMNFERPKKKQTPPDPTSLRERCTQLTSTPLPQQQQQKQEYQASCVPSSANNLMVTTAGVTTVATTSFYSPHKQQGQHSHRSAATTATFQISIFKRFESPTFVDIQIHHE